MMKPTKKFLCLVILISGVSSFAAEKRAVRLEDVAKRISQNNYKVYENALKVYQAKANIEKARADMLPKLNIWSIGRAIIDPLSLFDQITDIAPFLVPANWFRNQEVKLLYLAEREGHRALWANEVHVAKTLFIQIWSDQNLLKHVVRSRAELERIHRILKTRETFGGAPPGTARDIEIKVIGLMEDEQNLKVLLRAEQDQLTFMLGISTKVEVELAPLKLSVVADLRERKEETYEFRVLAESPERRQFEHFLSVVSQIKKEIKYGFMGASKISRGVAGGIFDNLPVVDGGGAGQAAAMNIVDAQREILKVQKIGVEETLKRQLRANVFQYNSDIALLPSLETRATLASESKEALIRRIQLGENIDIVNLAEASRTQIQAETSYYAIHHRILTGQDRLNRLVFAGDYAANPPLVDSLKGKK